MFKKLIYSNDFNEFVTAADNKVSELLFYGNHSDFIDLSIGNSIDIGSKQGTISYIPTGKSIRVDVKAGRFINRFVKKEVFEKYNITPSVIEEFVNLYKSYTDNDLNFLVVEGDDILKYYCEDNYDEEFKTGHLWNSCMRQSSRNHFMKLYAINDVKMLVSLSKNGKVKCRALLWDNVNVYGEDAKYKFMDRIYGQFEHDVFTFKKWATKNGYITKWQQSADSEMTFDVFGDFKNLDLFVEMSNCDVEYYPYLDTFKFYDIDKNKFYNCEDNYHSYILTQSSGGYMENEEA